jgi:MYXO-CTERM domain-containing protein
MKLRVLLALVGSFVLAPRAFAADVLYCNDRNLTTDRMRAALTSLGGTITLTSTTSITTCESQVALGGWELVILAIQNSSYSTPTFNAYVTAGGYAILQDWTRDSTRGSLFNVTYSGSNLSSVTITSATLASGLASNPFSLTNPGWGTYSMPMVGTGGATQMGTFSANSSVVLGSSGRTIVNGFLTDTGPTSATTLYVNEIHYLIDLDGDGYTSTDCDDTDATVHPGAVELCNSVDDDCDGVVDDGAGSAWYVDSDGDSYGGTTSVVIACTAPSGYISTGTDCDDTSASVHPGATEYCNSVDDDCDTVVDNAAVDGSTWYVDRDGDTYGNPSIIATSCGAPVGYVGNATDCNDRSATVHPGADEYCNGVDDDCDSIIDESGVDGSTWYADADGDSYGDATTTTAACSAPAGYVADGDDCDDTTTTVNPGAIEYCNGIDDDCDASIDNGATDAVTWYADADGDGYGNATHAAAECSAPSGYVGDATDCNDASATVHPGASEYCNGVDDDCDRTVDESAVDASTWYADADGDSFGDATVIALDCALPTGYSGDDRDCDDTDAAVNPDALEICNTLDDDCDGTVDLGADDASTWYTDADGDTWGDPATAVDACSAPSGTRADDTDCDDTSATVHPTADEHCNGIDDDCDGTTDEDAVDLGSWHANTDGDGYGDPAVTSVECTAPVGYLADATDCDDADATVFPGAPESADGIDGDCDGVVDEGTAWYDDDGDGYTEDGGDCDDADGDVHPSSPETTDGVDEDCDGVADDGTASVDDDGDGVSEDGGDCNDGDPRQSPGNTEIDGNGIDDDCDGAVDDGVYDPDADGYTGLGGDCAGEDAAIHPGAPEIADGVDNDCDGAIDEGTTDVDNDGDGYTAAEGDCDDQDASIGVGADDIVDGVDNDCDGDVDEGTDAFDDDGDGYTEEGGDCDDADPALNPAADDVLNGIDDDCDGVVDAGVLDVDQDGYTVEAGDCDDTTGWANPSMAEVCDGIDNNCDGVTDEDCTTDDDPAPKVKSCGCASAADGAGSGSLLGVGLLALVGLRRRTRSRNPATEI